MRIAFKLRTIRSKASKLISKHPTLAQTSFQRRPHSQILRRVAAEVPLAILPLETGRLLKDCVWT